MGSSTVIISIRRTAIEPATSSVNESSIYYPL